MADWDLPTNTSPEIDVLDILRDKDESSAKMFEGSTDTNIPIGSKKLDTSSGFGVFSRFNGSVWNPFVISTQSLPVGNPAGGKGIVPLNDSLTSTDTYTALTANQGKVLKGLIDLRFTKIESDQRYVLGQAGTAVSQFRNNGQNDTRFSIGYSLNNSDFYQEDLIDVYNDTPSGISGDFTSGTVSITRIGRLITLKVNLSHNSDSAVLSDPELLPIWARPQSGASNVYYFGGGYVSNIDVYSNGVIGTSYYLTTGSSYNRTSTGIAHITYSI